MSTEVFQLPKIKHFANFHPRKTFFSAHSHSLIDYGSTLWDSASKNCLKLLHSLCKRAIKLVLLKRSSLEQGDYNLLNILPLHTSLKYNKGIYMQKIIAGNATPSLTRLFPTNSFREQNIRSISLGLESTYSMFVCWLVA